MNDESLSCALDETLDLFATGGEPWTTKEVATRLDIGRRSTYERLERLVDRELLLTKKVGASARVWWRPQTTPNGRDTETSSDLQSTAKSLADETMNDAAVGAFVLDDEFDVMWIDDEMERYFDLDRGDVVGRDKRQLIDASIAPAIEDSETFTDVVLSTYDDNTYTERFECHVLPDDGREGRWLEHRSRPIESGEFAGGRVELYYDVTDWKHSERARRNNRQQFESLVEAVEEYAIFTLDVDGAVQSWNVGASRILGYDADEIDGEHVSTFHTDADREAGIPRKHLERAAEERWFENEGWRVREDGSQFWADVTITAIYDDHGKHEGYAKVIRDMTHRREYEEQLEAQAERLERQRDELDRELDEVFERIDDGFFALDEDLRFTYVNDWASDLLDVAASELVGAYIWDVLEPEPNVRAVFDEALESQKPTSFEEYSEPLDAWFQNQVYPTESGISVYFRDVTERKEREQALEQYETIVETTSDGVYMIGEDGGLEMVNQAFADMLGYDRERLLGTPAASLLDDETTERARTMHAELETESEDTARLEIELETAAGDDIVTEATFTTVESNDGEVGVGVVRDVTDRIAHEHELARQASLLDSLFEQIPVNLYVKDEEGRHVRTSTPYLRDEYPDEEFFRGKTDLDIYPEELASETYADDMQVIESGEPVMERVEFDPSKEDWLLTSKVPWREDDGEIRGLIGVSRIITEQKEAEIELEQHRQQLTAINSLNELVQEITSAVIDQSTRAEIEDTLCEHLAKSDSYSFAWIGDVDATSRTVELRTEAGVDGYLDDVTITVDPDDERSDGPTSLAFRTGAVQTTQDIRRDDCHDPWRDHLERYDIRSSAAIPIVHEGTVYAVLNVYADRPDAFQGRERAVVSQLGEVVGHAIAATERKRALLSDEVVKLAFRIPDVFAEFSDDGGDPDPVSLDQSLHVGGDEYVVYGSVTGDSLDAVEFLVDAVPHWQSVSFRDPDDDVVRFEIRVSGSPLLSALASQGGFVDEAVIEDGDYFMRIQVGAAADVRRVIDAVQTAYPEAEMLSRQQTARSDDRSDSVQRVVSADLTDRQRATLEAAYHSGFFEWPRAASGEDVASSLDVSSPTFHQHLRKAERKVFDALLSDGPATA